VVEKNAERMGDNGEEAVADVGELRRRLDMAEDELTFLKAVFEEYKDSSGELEAELDAQLKDLERSNTALKRENDQIRNQLQSTVARSRKSAEEASNLTTALEAHLEELTKREKKAQTKIKSLEQDLADSNAAGAAVIQAPETPTVTSEELDRVKTEKARSDKALDDLKEMVFDARLKSYKVVNLTESRFSTGGMDRQVPQQNYECGAFESISADLNATQEDLEKCEELLKMTKMSYMMVKQVGEMMGNDLGVDTKLEGGSEQAINSSCLIMLGKLMVLASTLPEFKTKARDLKASIDTLLSSDKDEHTKIQAAPDCAHEILTFCEKVTISVFEPMQESNQKKRAQEKADEMEKLKTQGMDLADKARQEAEENMKKLMEEKLNELAASKGGELAAVQREHSEKAAQLEKERAHTQEKIEEMKKQAEEALQSARSEARAMAEKARQEAIKETSANKKTLEEEIYASVASEMDKLRAALEESQSSYQQKARQQEMYQKSMQTAVTTQADRMKTAMQLASEELVELKRSTQRELSETQKVLNDNLNHVRKVARTIAKSDVASLSMMYERELDMRVKLQDQVQALKGNIRVFCRIRPLISKELEAGETESVKIMDEMNLRCEDPDTGKENSFTFDRVFDPDANQEIVFDELRTLCLSAMDGYNVCIFAYGITGSGKTYTVEGGEDLANPEGRRGANPKLAGLVYRTVKEVFRIAHGERGGAYETEIKVQCMECYQEVFRDLQTPEKRAVSIKLIGAEVMVGDVVVKPVKNTKEAMDEIGNGYGNRTTRGTTSNDLSSRSHSVLTLHIKSVNLRTKKVYKGQLHFVDLAGSERVKKSEVTGQAFEEATSINKSLSALGDVISSLSSKKDHVPFRNSALTTLLKSSLGGNSKTVMISNISPAGSNLSETTASLRFATRVHKVEMGKAQQTEMSEEPTSKAKDLKAKMAQLDSKFKGKVADHAPLNSARGRPKDKARSPRQGGRSPNPRGRK